mmetsp:Transcript_6713/g.9881  ORF Transcript_6713/g.9881 Transcript_6713/m.9881 type:complete len:249 (+) Transcript_6713:36-782(+)
MAAEKEHFLSKLEKRRQTKSEMAKMKLGRQRRQDEETKREHAEAKKRETQLAQISYITKARADLEKKHAKERQQRKEMLSNGSAAELERRSARELELFIKDKRIQDQKEQLKSDRELRKKQELEKVVHESRQVQIQLKLRNIENEKRHGILLAEEFKRVNIEEQEKERVEKIAQRQKSLELQRLQREQIEEERKEKIKRKEDELKREQQVTSLMTKENDFFKEFAMKEIELFKAQGKKTSIIESALKA